MQFKSKLSEMFLSASKQTGSTSRCINFLQHGQRQLRWLDKMKDSVF